MAKKLKLAEGISKPLVINSDYSSKTDVILRKDGTSTGKQLFFGIRKNNSIDNELDDTYNKYIPSDPYIEDCVVQLYNSPYSNGKSIVYNLSENTTGSTRLITFKYNGTVLFKINQNPKELTYNSENVYICVVPSISEAPKNIWLFAKFSDSLPRPDTDYKTMTEFDSSYTGDEPEKKYNGRTWYFSEHTLPARKTLKELKESNILTAIHENTTFTANTNYDTDIPYHLVQVNRTDANTPYNILSDKSEAFKKEYLMCSIGSSNTVCPYQHKPKFNVFDNSYYYGIYKYNNQNTSTNVYIIYFTCSNDLYGSYFSSDQGYSHGDISDQQGGEWNSKSYNVLWYFTDNNQSSFNINETRVKNIIANNILTYNSGKNLLNTEPYKNFIIQKGPSEYMHDAIYTTGENVKLTDDIYIYENNSSGNSKISVSPINFSKITESYHIGVYTYNKNNDVVHTKKKYTIYMFGQVPGGHFVSNQKCYLFSPNESRVTTDVEYTQISVKGDVNNINYGTYFILDNSGQLTSDIFNHVTIYELQKYYNLTKISGDIYLTNACYVNNITDPNIVNVFGSTNKGTLRNTQNNTYVKVAWLYNKSSDNTYYTNAKESWGTHCIINVTKPDGIFTIEV